MSSAVPAYLREGIGTDYPNYANLYRIYRYSDDNHELGFRILAKICWYFDANPHTFLAILAIIPLFLVTYYVPKKHYGYFVIIYILTSYFNIISVSRQEVSIALMICAIFALEKNHGTIKYLLDSTGAILFHSSSFLYYPVLLLRKIKIGPMSILIMLLCLLFILLGVNVVEWIFTNPLFLASKYSKYLDTDYISETKLGTGLGILVNLILPMAFLLFYRRSSNYTSDANFICWLTICFIGSYVLATQTYIFGRLVAVFRFVPAFIAYPTCKAISRKYPYLVFMFFFLLYLVLFEKAINDAQFSLHRGLGISPFRTIFD